MNTLDVHIKKDRGSNLQNRFLSKNSFRFSDNGVTVSVLSNSKNSLSSNSLSTALNNSTTASLNTSCSSVDMTPSPDTSPTTNYNNTSRIQVLNSNAHQRMRTSISGRTANLTPSNHIRWEGGKVVHIQDSTIERHQNKGIARELRESRLRQSKLFKSSCDIQPSQDGENVYTNSTVTDNSQIISSDRYSKVIKITPDEDNPSYHVETDQVYSKTVEQKLQEIQTNKISKILPMDFNGDPTPSKWRGTGQGGRDIESSNTDLSRPRFGTRLVSSSTLRHRSCSFSTQTRPKLEEHRGRNKLSNFSFRIRSSSVSSFSSSSSSDSALGSEEFWNQYRRQPSRNIIYRIVRKAISRRPSNVSEYEYKTRLPDTLPHQASTHTQTSSNQQTSNPQTRQTEGHQQAVRQTEGHQQARLLEGLTSQQLAARLNELHNNQIVNSNRVVQNDNISKKNNNLLVLL